MKTKPTPTSDDPHAQDPRSWLSALADGDAGAADSACKAWRDDGEARQTWHAYQLIGDVMRSEELARSAVRDEAFLQGLRVRLASEPVVLAPAPVAEPVRRRQPWLLPVAAAAGFVVVAGVLVVARVSQPGAPAAASFASASAAAGGAVRVAGDTLVVPAGSAQGDTLYRDARLDEYLRAHQSARGGLAVAAPGGALRRVEMTVPAAPNR
jgi:sigma-E factor negative regulatory protein RseA